MNEITTDRLFERPNAGRTLMMFRLCRSIRDVLGLAQPSFKQLVVGGEGVTAIPADIASDVSQLVGNQRVSSLVHPTQHSNTRRSN